MRVVENQRHERTFGSRLSDLIYDVAGVISDVTEVSVSSLKSQKGLLFYQKYPIIPH